MSDRMGPLSFGKQDEQIFLGREIAQHKDYSEVTAVAIDEEVKRLVTSGYNTARTTITDNIQILHAIAQALIEQEELSAEEVHRIVTDWGGAGSDNGSPPVVQDSPSVA
jgi:cell division protease FtsH